MAKTNVIGPRGRSYRTPEHQLVVLEELRAMKVLDVFTHSLINETAEQFGKRIWQWQSRGQLEGKYLVMYDEGKAYVLRIRLEKKMPAKKSGDIMMLFNTHREFCKECFHYSVMNEGAPLCLEGLDLQRKWKELHDAEGIALHAIGKKEEKKPDGA